MLKPYFFTAKITLVIILLCINFEHIYAQPVITRAEYPIVNDIFWRLILDTTAVQQGEAMANADWSFIGLHPTGAAVSPAYKLPADTPYATSFPTSNLVEQFSTERNYLEVSDTAVVLIGTVRADGTFMNYSDPLVKHRFPLTYNTFFTDTAHRDYVTVGDSVQSRITLSVQADAYGTLRLPIGTFENTLRVHSIQTYRDTLPSNPNAYFESYAETYEWLEEGSRSPILIIQRGYADQSGNVVPIFKVQCRNQPQVVDQYGYTQANSLTNNNLACQWIDITEIGTPIDGLSDDNFIGPFDIGFDFPYYWTTKNQFWVGSNGYLAFSPIQIASSGIAAFPSIPTADATNDFVAPFLSDLNFLSATGNSPAQAYFWTNNSDSCVVSFIDVPFWTNNTNGQLGTNTFQVVFAAADSSVTFNYQHIEEAIASEYQGRYNPILIGIENPNGQIGIQYTNLLPPSNFCIKFRPPAQPQIELQDAQNAWHQQPDNGGVFAPYQAALPLSMYVRNAGNVPITSPLSITGEVRRFDDSVFDTYNATTTGEIPVGGGQTIELAQFPAIETGTFSLETRVLWDEDIQLSNNVNVTEIVVTDTLANGEMPLDFVQSDNGVQPNNGILSWSAASNFNSGAGVWIKPPFTQSQLTAVEVFVTPNGGVIEANYKIAVYNIDANGNIGELLVEQIVPLNTILSSAWNRHNLVQPVPIGENGVLIAWLMGGAGIALATDTDPPFSRRTYEYVGGAWAPYRNAQNTDFFIRGYAKSVATATNVVEASVQPFLATYIEQGQQLTLQLPDEVIARDCVVSLYQLDGKCIWKQGFIAGSLLSTILPQALLHGMYICRLEQVGGKIWATKLLVKP